MSTIVDAKNKEIIQKLITFINEEKFIRDFSSYQLNKIEMYIQYAKQLANASKEDQSEALQLLADYKNNENEKSVLGRLIPPIIAFSQSLERDPSEENKLFDLIISVMNDFQLSSRWAIVEYIADQILSLFPKEIQKLRNHPNIVDVLRLKMDAKEKLVGKKETKTILKMIVEIDRKDFASRIRYAKLIQPEDPHEANKYLREAAEILAKENKTDKLDEIWKQLVDENFEDVKFFDRLERILSNNKNYSFIVASYQSIMEKFKEIEDWDTVIYFLKKIIQNALEAEKREESERRNKDPQSKGKRKESKILTKFREELIRAYKNKYKNHSLIDVFLRLSNLSNSKIPITIGINNFEKYIVFDAGNYVYHRTRGVGKIKEINDKFIIVDFEKYPNQKMSLDLAISNLQALQKDHLWVMDYENKEELKRIFEQDKIKFFMLLLNSYNRKITLSQIKKELFEKKLLTEKEWNKWWQETRKLLKENPMFGFNPKKRDEILMWERELSYSEELENKFNNVKEWEKKLEIAIESITMSPELTEKAAETIAEYFLAQESKMDPRDDKKKVIEIFLFFEYFKQVFPDNPIPKERKNKKEHIIEIIKGMDDEEIVKFFEELKITEFKKGYVDLVIESKENYPELLKKILFEGTIKIHKYIIDELDKRNHKELLSDFLYSLFRKYKENPELFLWFGKNIIHNNWEEEYDWISISKYDFILQLFRLIKFLSKLDIRGNKLRNSAIEAIFGTTNINLETLEKSKLKEFIQNGSEDFVLKLYIIFRDTPNIPQAHKENLWEFIKKIKPDISLISMQEEIEEEVVSLLPPEDIVYITKEAIEKLRKHLDHLIYVEMPENAREIGEAQEKGDLRENAEYKAALERQDKLRAEIKKLEEELKKVRPIDPDKIRTDLVSIGTKVTLKDHEGNSLQYTILGPWDTDPELNIISYASPLGKSLIGKRVGDIAQLSSEKTFTIEKIEKAIE
ncbi:MAG: transcription elongation factor GreA [Leptospiraceae bacterium]|nr:transcription elongation factor GreA [Leptospiraceae bacterium]MDW7975534.1 transcription elongation factor GreA [Leptospiraceae bacterium]